MQATKHASKGIHSGFETQGRHHQKSKTGVSVVPEKGLMSSKYFFKKKSKERIGKSGSMTLVNFI